MSRRRGKRRTIWAVSDEVAPAAQVHLGKLDFHFDFADVVCGGFGVYLAFEWLKDEGFVAISVRELIFLVRVC